MEKEKKPEETKLKEPPKDPDKSGPTGQAEFVATIEGMIDVVGISDMDGRIIQINTAVKDWGYEKEELIRKPVVEVLAKRSLPKLEEERKKTLKTGVMRNLELIGLRKNGSEFPVLVNVTLMKDAEGKPTGRIFSLRDITELKRAQEKEKELAATAAAEKAKREAVEESRAVLEERAKKLADSRTAMIHMLKSLDETGKEMAAARDYTDNIIKSMIDTLLVVDPDAKIRTINPATVELLGYKEDELIGKPVATIFAEEEEEEVSIFKGTRLKKLIEKGTIRDYDMRYRTKKGEVIPVSFSGSAMRDKDGDLVGIVGIARDMRAMKRLMEKEKKIAAVVATEKARTAVLEKAKKTLEKRVRERTRELERVKVETEDLLTELDRAYKELKGTQDELVRREKLIAAGGLAAGVAHEIRNPLSIIGMSVQYLHSKFKEDDPRREFTEAIIDKVEKLDKVTKGLIDYARPRKLNLGKRNIHKILDRVLRLSKHKCHAQKVKIIKRYAKSMPRVNVDDDLMEQVFLNLISNTLWAMSKGGELKISTRIHTNKDTKQHEVEIRFTDTGCGIPEKEIDRIFDPFFTTRNDGSGLGLSIVHRIMEDHKGSIDVESEVGKGTTFTIVLPVKR